MSCVASYLLWNEKTKAPVQVLYYHHHLWIIWWSQPLDFIAERAKGWHLQMSADLPGMDAPGNRLQLAQVVCWWKSAFNHLLASTCFNPSRERHMKSSSQTGMKRTWKNRNQSQNLPLQFSMAHSFEKRKQSRASALKFYQRRRHKFLEGPGTKKKPGYGMGNNYIKLEQCLILYWVCSPTWLVGCTCYKLYHYIPCKSMYIILYPYITLYNYVCNTILVNNPPTSPPGDIPQQRDHDQLTLHSTTMQSWCEGKCCYEYVGEHLQTSGSLLGSMSIAKLTSIRTVIRSTCEMNGKLTALTTVQESSGCNMAETYESLLYWYQ